MVGSPQAIQCIVFAVSGVELSSVMINWMGPDGNLITDNSRIIVNPITSFGDIYVNGLHFIYLMEGDEGMYTCNVTILETTQTSVAELSNLTCKYTNLITIIIRNIFHWLAITTYYKAFHTHINIRNANLKYLIVFHELLVHIYL